MKIRASEESILDGFDSHIEGLESIRDYIFQLESNEIPQTLIDKIDQQSENIEPHFHWWVGISNPPINNVSYISRDVMHEGSLLKDREMSWETVKYPSLTSIFKLSERYPGVVFDLDFENMENSIKGRVAFKEGRVKVYR